MSNLRTFILCWIIMWGSTYFAVAFVAPKISDTPPWIYIAFSLFIMATLACYFYNDNTRFYSRMLFIILAAVEVYSGVVSWTGAGIWNVPFPNKELFQVSMAFADLLSAVFMLWVALIIPDEDASTKPVK